MKKRMMDEFGSEIQLCGSECSHCRPDEKEEKQLAESFSKIKLGDHPEAGFSNSPDDSKNFEEFKDQSDER